MSRPLLGVHSVLVFLQIIFGATVLGEFFESRWIGLGQIVVAAAQAALAFYQRGDANLNTPDGGTTPKASLSPGEAP